MSTVQNTDRAAQPPTTLDHTARLLDTAADLITTCGHTRADLWDDAHHHPWRPNLPLSLAGAVCVARGHTTYQAAITAWARTVDPAIITLARHLGWRGPITAALPGLWAWEDRTPAVFLAVALHRCAADLRAAVTCVSCGAEYGHPHYPWCQFTQVTS